MTAKLIGILTDIFPTETFPSGFSKRVIWVKQPDTERYPQHWQMELHGADVSRVDQYKIGDTLEVEVEIRGKKWEKYPNKQGIIITLKCVGILLKERLPAMTSRLPR